MRKVDVGLALCHLHVTNARQRLEAHEEVRHAATSVFAVVLGTRTRLHRQWLAHIADQLLATLVDAENRMCRIERASAYTFSIVYASSASLSIASVQCSTL